MTAIDEIISELAGIPDALCQGDDDPRRPRRRPSLPERLPVAEPISSDPIFEADQWEITDQALWQEEKERARRAVEQARPLDQLGAPQVGLDALAWYVSFHNNQRAWGIYIPLSTLALMEELYLRKLRTQRERRLRLAWSVMLLHEQMHFAVDYACAWLELMLRAPIRREFMDRFNSRPPLTSITASETYLNVEETAANAYMLRELRRTEPRRVVKMVEQFVATQPSGYREGLEASSDAAFDEAVANTLRSYFALWAIEHRLDLGNPAMNLTRLLPLEDQRILAECPVYSINDLEEVGITRGAVRLVQRISSVMETENFKKQFQRQDPKVRADWLKKKEQIKVGLPRHPRFEKLNDWNPPTWSLRLCKGHRVHLLPPSEGTIAWRAVGIGSHEEMGHG